RENLCNFEIEDNEPDVLQVMATKTMEDILTDVLRLENFNLKQSSSIGDSPLRVGQSLMSRPSGLKNKEVRYPELDLDPRLRNWNRVLNQRQKIQERIERQTGKRAEDVLFNRSTSIDDASKKMILRILDTADRSRPIDQLKEKSTIRSLKARDDPENCREIKELFLAEPKIQELEFVGLPQVTQKEVAAINLPPDAPESQWQRSEVLVKQLEEKKQSIEQVLEFAPDIHQLQVIPTYTVPSSDTPLITKLGEVPILPLSCDSTVEEEEMETDHELDLGSFEGEEIDSIVDSMEPQSAPTTKEKSVHNVRVQDLDPFLDVNGVMINGVIFDYDNSVKSAGRGIQLELKCNPHQRVVKPLLDIQNLSKKLVNVSWQPKIRIRTDRPPMHSELIFDRSEFILEPLERRVVRIMFQPQHVGLYTLRYILCIIRSPFCNSRRLDVIIRGQCTVPEVYKRRLEMHKQIPLDKQQEQQARDLLNLHATLAPIIENATLLCPYERALDEREVFNAQNMNYRCERYEDLEALKSLYSVAKKPRDRPWDLSLDTLRRFISNQENRLMREHLHLQMVKMLEPMKCNRCEALTKLEHNPERERTCFIYVRGTICSAVDEWEKMALGLDDQFFKLELLRVLEERRARQEKLNDDRLSLDSFSSRGIHKMIPFYDNSKSPSEEEDVVVTVSKRLKTSKYLRDALYMHTYNLLCDVAEDIVSVIESTTV
ncbi:hypothetical protein KR067_007601, partial [Drosophila pandora]